MLMPATVLLGAERRAAAADGTANTATTRTTTRTTTTTTTIPARGLPSTMAASQPNTAAAAVAAAMAVAAPLTAKGDTYNGKLINPTDVSGCVSADEFGSRLKASVDLWRAEGRNGIWLELAEPNLRRGFLAAALNLGFELHHAEKDHVTLTYFIPGEKGKANTLPGYSTHTVGVGALCMNSKNEVLVVQEKSGPAARYKLWKMPTGMVDSREDACDAAKREVLEETGVEVEVLQMVGMREAHMSRAAGSYNVTGRSNLFCVFLCRPVVARDHSNQLEPSPSS